MGENLQASRLLAAEVGDWTRKPPNISPPGSPKRSKHIEKSKPGGPSDDVRHSLKALVSKSQKALPLERTLRRGLAGERTESEGDQPPQSKRPRNDAGEFKMMFNLNSLVTDRHASL